MNGNLPDSWDQALIRSTPTKMAAPSYTYVVKKKEYIQGGFFFSGPP